MLVYSAKSLGEKFDRHIKLAAANALEIKATPRKRNAIFAIHGISPMQRYAFQDQLANALESYLNAIERSKPLPVMRRAWKTIVHWPLISTGSEGTALRPSALRVYCGNDPDAPDATVYDVYEGYWSPLSKGKTNIRSAVRWLLNSTFLATSSTANIPCDRPKLKWDLWYVFCLLFLIAIVLIAALLAGFGAWTAFAAIVLPSLHGSYWNLLRNPIDTALKLPIPAYAELIVDVIAAYLLAQLFVLGRVIMERRARTRELMADAGTDLSRFRAQTLSAGAFQRMAAVVLCVAFLLTAVLAILIGYYTDQFHAFRFAWYSALIVLAVGLFQFARSKADFAVESVLGDIQIYTTHDNNSTFYSIRQQIIENVSAALTGVLRATEDPGAANPQPYYDAIHILGHSLGSTIAMDTLILLRKLVQEGALTGDQWGRIRSFTTFGTALEKTRFFFDVRQATISAAQDQWENDVYGRFFTDDPNALHGPDNSSGIYWSNFWYFHDVVANEIVSYASDASVGKSFTSFTWSATSKNRPICRNYLLENRRPPWAWVHSDYLNDEHFWGNLAPVLGAG